MDAAGSIDFTTNRAALSATLYDSTISGIKVKHPDFPRIPADLKEMDRVSFTIGRGDDLRATLQA
jgi:hypothetical protein